MTETRKASVSRALLMGRRHVAHGRGNNGVIISRLEMRALRLREAETPVWVSQLVLGCAQFLGRQSWPLPLCTKQHAGSHTPRLESFVLRISPGVLQTCVCRDLTTQRPNELGFPLTRTKRTACVRGTGKRSRRQTQMLYVWKDFKTCFSL